MKNYIILTIFTLLALTSFAQDRGLTYQAVIYNPSGQSLPGEDDALSPLVETNICLKFSIIGSGLEYEETVQTTTDMFGMVNIKIGANTQTGGSASSISDVNWDSGEKSMRVELNPVGNCNSFVQISYQTFSYVPFAYYAQNDSTAEAIADLQTQVTENQTASEIADEDLLSAIDAVQLDVDQNEEDADAAIAGLQAQIDADDTDFQEALDMLQADVDENEENSDIADAGLLAIIEAAVAEATEAITANAIAIATTQADVDLNEADSDAADAALQVIIEAAIAEATEAITNNAVAIAVNANSIAVVQADVDQNEADSDTADAALQAIIEAAIAEATDAITNNAVAIATTQADVDQNESDADAAIAALQADIDQNEADADAADAALQQELDGTQMDVSQQYGLILTLESDVDNIENTIAVVQEDVNQNEADSDAADAALQLELDTTQSGAGLQDDGSYVANTSMTYINASTSIVDATEDLDAAISALQESNSALQALIDNLQSQVDNLTNTGTYTPTVISGTGNFTEANWIQMGDMVIVFGNFNSADLTHGMEITIDTPTTNTFSSSTDASGNIAGYMMMDESVGGSITASPGTNRVIFSGAGAHMMAPDTDGGYVFSYNLGGGTTYTPTSTGNITLSPANYSINGSTVVVNGNFTNGDFGFGGFDSVEISIPTSSTFSNTYDATGVASSIVMGESGAGHVQAVPNSSNVAISITGAHMIAIDAEGSYTFTYNTSSGGGLIYNPTVSSGSADISNVQYFKYGDMVIVSGLIDNVSSGTVISIPVSSFFTSPYDVKGLVTGSDYESAAGVIQAVTNSETVEINFRGAHGQTNFDSGSFIFSYKL